MSQPDIVAVRRLTTLTSAGAKLACQAVEAKAVELGITLNIAICDHTTQLLHFVRMDDVSMTHSNYFMHLSFELISHNFS